MRLATLLDAATVRERWPALPARDLERWVELGRSLRRLGHPDAAATRAFFAPGRLEIAGKHTDYAGGRSLTAATEQGFRLAVVARPDSRLGLYDLRAAQSVVLDPDGGPVPGAGGWATYPGAVASRMARDFGLAPGGADVAFWSDLPAAAGLSSSSALVVATWLALAAVRPVEESPAYRREIDGREGLAAYLAAVEAGRRFGDLAAGRGAGTRGGSEDHTAILCSRAGYLGCFSYEPTRREQTIALPADLAFAVAVSGVAAEKACGARDAYNRAASLAAELAFVWRRETGGDEPHLAAIRARGAAAGERLVRIADRLDGLFAGGRRRRRLEHFVAESEEIVPAAAETLAAGDLAAFGRVVDRSQRLAEKLLGNQVPETVHLAAGARSLGALAAAGFGAGFGGAVWALVERRRLASFLERWRTGYLDAHPRHRRTAAFLATRPGAPARELRPGEGETAGPRGGPEAGGGV